MFCEGSAQFKSALQSGVKILFDPNAVPQYVHLYSWESDSNTGLDLYWVVKNSLRINRIFSTDALMHPNSDWPEWVTVKFKCL